MDKEDTEHIYNGILISHKKEQNGSHVEMWMGLETVIHSEVNHKEKNKHCKLMHIYEIQKNGIDGLTCKTEIYADVEKKCVDSKRGKEVWGELGDWN